MSLGKWRTSPSRPSTPMPDNKIGYTWNGSAWIAQGPEKDSLAMVLMPVMDDAQTRIWLKSLLMDQFVEGAAMDATIATLAEVNGVALPIPADRGARDYYFPLYMVRPELGVQFTIDSPLQAAPGGARALVAPSSSVNTEPAQPGAYTTLNLAPGDEWTPEVYARALAGGEGGVLILQPKVRFVSAPLTDDGTPSYRNFVFLSPELTLADNPVLSIPVDLDYYNRFASQDDADNHTGSGGGKLLFAAAVVFVIFYYRKAVSRESENFDGA